MKWFYEAKNEAEKRGRRAGKTALWLVACLLWAELGLEVASRWIPWIPCH